METHDAKPIFQSALGFTSARIQAAAIYCSDGRYGDQVDDFLQLLLHFAITKGRRFTMHRLILAGLAIVAIGGQAALAANPAKLAEERAILAKMEIRPERLKPLALETAIVTEGRPAAVICHAETDAWRSAAAQVQKAIAEATGVTLPMKTDQELAPKEFDSTNVILLGHLDNHRYVARLYHNFFVTLDAASTGRSGYEIRSIHDPFGTRHNYILASGSFAQGTARAAEALGGMVRKLGRPGSLSLGRLVELKFDPTDCSLPPRPPMTEKELRDAIASGRQSMFSPGQGRSGVARLVDYGVWYHRFGDRRAGDAYRAMMLALLEYYAKDAYINSDGMARYDRDFRDAWTHEVAILFDLHEESGLFSTRERLEMTNLLVRLGLECVLYQGWNRPASIQKWAVNRDIVHNHATFPALGVLFAGNYLKRHYGVSYVNDWLTVAHGIFNGQKHCSKPLEDAAGYQWLPVIHTMIAGLAEGDLTFFEEGHARQAAQVALMVMDNAGYQGAFGDHSALKSASGLGATLQMAGWYYKDPELVWGARLAGRDSWFPLEQTYSFTGPVRPPASQIGVTVSRLPRPFYDTTATNGRNRIKPNLPHEQSFDKLAFRGGWDRDDEYLLLDGFGRGNHMHFDSNAIISFAAGGEPLLVDAEYIKNGPKYHNSLLVIRDGLAEPIPPVTGLARADYLAGTGYSRTWLNGYSGATWTREIVWRRSGYLLVSDTVRAEKGGDYTLRCCWRPWGEPVLDGSTLTVSHAPMRLILSNADGAAQRLETMRVTDRMPISRLSQQVNRTLKPGQSYRFLNLVRAERTEKAQPVSVKQARDGLALVEHSGGRDVVALGGSAAQLSGIQTDAELVLLAADGSLALAGCKRFSDSEPILEASSRVSLELDPKDGSGALLADTKAQVSLRLVPGASLQIGGDQLTADATGHVKFQAPAGRHALRFAPFGMYPRIASCGAGVSAAPSSGRKAAPSDEPSARGAGQTPAPKLPLAWSTPGLEPIPEMLPVSKVQSSAPPVGQYGPVEKLTDGASSGSNVSVMWKPGVRPAITLELADRAQVRSVLLREWRLGSGHDIGRRVLELSRDGFQKDVRRLDDPFRDAGRESFGQNVNTLVEAQVGQEARQLRLTLEPAQPSDSVYLAEVEIRGVRPGVLPEIRAVATGDLDGDGREETIAAGDGGQIRAIDGEGRPRWTFTSDDHATVQAVACIDLDGNGRTEVAFGTAGGRLGLLSADGKLRWTAEPPKFRGTTSGVMTIFPADVSGDKGPEIVCGCVSWQYFAYSAAGKMLWQNVIYAHSATVGCAADTDGDGKDEVVAGNAYYQLNLIDHDGKRLWVASLGPEMTAVGAGDLDGDGTPEILAGVDHGDLHCYDRTGKQLWQTNLGDKVTRILSVDLDADGRREAVCAAESANVFAVKADGSLLWRRSLPDGAGDLALVVARDASAAPRLIVAAGEAGLVMLDAAGHVIGRGETVRAARSVAVIHGMAMAVCDGGMLHAIAIP